VTESKTKIRAVNSFIGETPAKFGEIKPSTLGTVFIKTSHCHSFGSGCLKRKKTSLKSYDFNCDNAHLPKVWYEND
jgi:hypothetical protein